MFLLFVTVEYKNKTLDAHAHAHADTGTRFGFLSVLLEEVRPPPARHSPELNQPLTSWPKSQRVIRCSSSRVRDQSANQSWWSGRGFRQVFPPLRLNLYKSRRVSGWRPVHGEVSGRDDDRAAAYSSALDGGLLLVMIFMY